MKRILTIGLTLVTQAFGSVPQPDPVASIDEFGHAHIEWQSVSGRTYFPRVSTDLVNWSYLPGEVFLGDGSVLQGLSFPPPLDERTFVSLHFTDTLGAHLLTSDTDFDGFDLEQELNNNTDPTLFDAGGGGTGYPTGHPGRDVYSLPPNIESGKAYDLIITTMVPGQPEDFTIVALDKEFHIIGINGITGPTSAPDFPIPLLVGPEDLVIEIQLESKNPVDNDTYYELLEYKSYIVQIDLEKELNHLRVLRIPEGEILSDKARIVGMLPGTDLTRLLLPIGLRSYRPDSDRLFVVEWDLTEFEKIIPFEEELDLKIRRNSDGDNENNVLDEDELVSSGWEDDLLKFNFNSTFFKGNTLIVKKSNGIRVWNLSNKSSLLADAGETEKEIQIGLPGDLFLEASQEINNGFFELWYPLNDSESVLLKRYNIETFKSCVIGFSGDQSAGGGTGWNDAVLRTALLDNGVYDISERLYLKGYNVFYYNEAQLLGFPNIRTSVPYLNSKYAVNTPGVDDLAIYGHSHGGGATYNLSTEISGNPNANITVAGYIDAVQQYAGASEFRYPTGAATCVNFYQKWLPLRGVSIPTAAINVNVSDNNPWIIHTTIDDYEPAKGEIESKV